jgi:hypothetical protein
LTAKAFGHAKAPQLLRYRKSTAPARHTPVFAAQNLTCAPTQLPTPER